MFKIQMTQTDNISSPLLAEDEGEGGEGCPRPLRVD